MFFAIDIDGTIAGRNVQQFAYACNEAFHLDLTPRQVERIGYRKLMEHPAMLAYQQQVGVDVFQRTIQKLDLTQEALLTRSVLPGSVEGIERLATLGEIGYYTVRKDPVKSVTVQWLHEQGFSSSENVVCCRSIMQKLVLLGQQQHERLIFIDDRALQLQEAFFHLEAGEHPHLLPARCKQIAAILQTKLTLVAFGSLGIPEQQHGLPLLALPSWEHIDAFIAALDLRRAETIIVSS